MLWLVIVVEILKFGIVLKFLIVVSVRLCCCVVVMIVVLIGCFDCVFIVVIRVSILLEVKLLVIFRLVSFGCFLVSVLVLFNVIMFILCRVCSVLFLWNSMFSLVVWLVLIMIEVGVVSFIV